MRSFKQYLTEVGDSSRPYQYTLTTRTLPRGFAEGVAKFKTDDGEPFTIDLASPSKAPERLDVIFMADNNKTLAVTNAGLSQAFRIIATVIQAAKEFIRWLYETKNRKIENIYFTSSGEKMRGKHSVKAAKQRIKLYMAFAKKQKDVEVVKTASSINGDSILRIKDSFYK